jgi:hypothetical protein
MEPMNPLTTSKEKAKRVFFVLDVDPAKIVSFFCDGGVFFLNRGL